MRVFAPLLNLLPVTITYLFDNRSIWNRKLKKALQRPSFVRSHWLRLPHTLRESSSSSPTRVYRVRANKDLVPLYFLLRAVKLHPLQRVAGRLITRRSILSADLTWFISRCVCVYDITAGSETFCEVSRINSSIAF